MAVTYSEDLRNARLDDITAQVGTSGLLRIYSGTRPAGGGVETTLLAELVCATSFAAAATGGTLTANAIADDTADASGTATWFRLATSTGVYVADGDVGLSGSGAELILDDTGIVSGGTVSVTSLVVTAGNA